MSKIEGGIRTSSPRMDAPMVSVITVVRNASAYLEKTIVSILKSRNEDMEYIIVDGVSTDDTLDYIRKYESSIDYWVSERDTGIYDAINKGITYARGKYFLVINVGDTLLEMPWNELKDCDLRGGEIAMFRVQLSNGRIHKSRIDYRLRFANTIHHQGAIYLKRLGIQYDSERYRTFADFDTNQKLWREGRKFIEYDKILCYHALDGSSNSPTERPEYFAVIRKNFGVFWEIVGRLYLKQFKVRKKIMSLFSK